jgi:hypothetical protein
MTRHDDADGVRAICKAYRSHCLGPSDLLRQLRVANRLPARDLSECAPDLKLKRSARSLNGDDVERRKISGKVSLEVICKTAPILASFEFESVRAIETPQQAREAFFMICPVNRAKTSIMICNEDHLADGRVNAVSEELYRLAHAFCPFD